MQALELTYREWMMALCIWREARGEIFAGMVGVGEAIRNRARARKRWPNRIVAVILQKWQFSSFNMFVLDKEKVPIEPTARVSWLKKLRGWTLFKGDPNAVKYPDEDDAALYRCCRAAKQALREGSNLAKGANHYHTTAVKPRWSRGKTPVKAIGNHLFFKL